MSTCAEERYPSSFRPTGEHVDRERNRRTAMRAPFLKQAIVQRTKAPRNKAPMDLKMGGSLGSQTMNAVTIARASCFVSQEQKVCTALHGANPIEDDAGKRKWICKPEPRHGCNSRRRAQPQIHIAPPSDLHVGEERPERFSLGKRCSAHPRTRRFKRKRCRQPREWRPVVGGFRHRQRVQLDPLKDARRAKRVGSA